MYSEGANQYAIYKLNVDWKEQAVLAAKSLQRYRYSKEKLVWQLINVELFTQEEADYAVEHVNFDWKEDACERSGILCKRSQDYERKDIKKYLLKKENLLKKKPSTQ